jgi:hypothetical protein
MIDNEVTGVCSDEGRTEASLRRKVCHNVAQRASKRDTAAGCRRTDSAPGA